MREIIAIEGMHPEACLRYQKSSEGKAPPIRLMKEHSNWVPGSEKPLGVLNKNGSQWTILPDRRVLNARWSAGARLLCKGNKEVETTFLLQLYSNLSSTKDLLNKKKTDRAEKEL